MAPHESGVGTAADADVLIIGAGVAGLTVGRALAQAGRHVIVVEAGSVAGGCVRLHDVGGIHVDRGADSFALARPSVGPLADDLGLAVCRPLAAPAWVRFADAAAATAPLPAATLLGVPADPTSADVRRVIGRVGALRARLDRALPPRILGAAGRGQRGFGALVHRRMGTRVLRRLVQPIVAGVYSTDPTDLDIDTVAPTLRAKLAAGQSLSAAVAALRAGAPPAGSAVAGIDGGMGALTGALLAAMRKAGGELRPGSPAVSIDRHGGNWAVQIGTGRVRLVAPEVVIASEASAAAELVARATGGALALPTAPSTPVAIVTLVVDEPLLDAHPRGTGVLVGPHVHGITAKALTHLTAKWRYVADQTEPGRHVLRLSYGRGPAGELPPDLALPDLALRDAAALLGVPLGQHQLVDAVVVHYPDQLAARPVGIAAAIDKFRGELEQFPGLSVAGAAVSGTGIAGIVTHATELALAIGARRGGTIGP